MLDFLFISVARVADLLCFAASVSTPKLSSFFLFLVCTSFPYPLSCLLIWSREVSSAVPPRITPPIFRSQSESGAYSRASLLRPAFRGGAPVLMLWSLVRTFWLMDSTGRSPPIIVCKASWSQHACNVLTTSCSYSGLLIIFSLPRFGSTPAGKQSG